jgi:hypothetical protein
MKNIFKKILKWFPGILITLFCILILCLLIRGMSTNSDTKVVHDTRILSPFELSSSSSRYALTESIVNDRSFLLSLDLARFSAPDVAYYKGKFFSLFTPGVSFIGIPFYLLGKYFGIQQIFTFLSTSLFALFNVFLVATLARKFGANKYAAFLSGFIFLFATDALPYSLTFTQHHISVTFILLSLLNALDKRTLFNNLLLGAYFGTSALVDIPNIIMLIPILFYVLYSHFKINSLGEKLNFKLNFAFVGILIGLIPFIILFAWYNFKTTGTYTKIGQTVGGGNYFKTSSIQNKPIPVVIESTFSKPLAYTPLLTRNQLVGFYALLISKDRSWMYYSPILFIGMLGLIFAFKCLQTKLAAKLGISVIFINVIAYSMFGDPWGGWAFGPRYLIPSAAVLAAAIGIVLQKFRKNIVFIIIFFLIFSYSVFINTLGALTTTAVAPKIEAEKLKPALSYTYEYNLGFIEKEQSGNLLYNIFLHKYLPLRYYWYVISVTIITVASIIIYLYVYKKGGPNE